MKCYTVTIHCILDQENMIITVSLDTTSNLIPYSAHKIFENFKSLALPLSRRYLFYRISPKIVLSDVSPSQQGQIKARH